MVASMVGTGILVSPGYLMLSLGDPWLIFGLWIIGGLLALSGAFCVAELATMFPRAGGEYVYIREAYGPLPAFLSGWTSFILGFSAPLAVSAYVASTYLVGPFVEGDAPGVVRLVAAFIIVCTTIPNLLGHRHSAISQNLTTIVKISLFAGLVAAALVTGRCDTSLLTSSGSDADATWPTIATQLFYVMFAYSGWNAACYLAGEVRDPSRVLPRALVMGTALVVILYLALMFVFATTVPVTAVSFETAERVPLMAVERLFGTSFAAAFSVAVGVAFLASVNALVVTGPRVSFAMSRDGLFPAIAGRVHERTGVPLNAMVAQSLCAIAILLAVEFQVLYKYAAVGLSIFALLFISAVYILRLRMPDAPRPFRVPGYPLTPALFMGVTIFMAIFAFREWPVPSLVSVGSILAGIPLYVIWRWMARRSPKG